MMYLPVIPCDTALSRWTGRPVGMTIDPLGVECFIPGPVLRGGLFRRRREPEVRAYLHVLVHGELGPDRVRSWAAGQVARLAALADEPDAVGDRLNRLAAEHGERIAAVEWTDTELQVDGHSVPGSCYVDGPSRWAAYFELGDDRVALVGRDLALAETALRTATDVEARALRMDALRV